MSQNYKRSILITPIYTHQQLIRDKSEIPDKISRSFWQDIENYSKRCWRVTCSVSYDKVTQNDKRSHRYFKKHAKSIRCIFCINGDVLDLISESSLKNEKKLKIICLKISRTPNCVGAEWDLLDVMKDVC